MAGRPAGLFACLAMAAALFVTIVLPAAARTGMDTAPASTVARSVDRVIVGYSPSTPAADKASIERAQGARLIPGSVRQSEGEGAVGLRPVSRTATTTDGSPRVMSHACVVWLMVQPHAPPPTAPAAPVNTSAPRVLVETNGDWNYQPLTR